MTQPAIEAEAIAPTTTRSLKYGGNMRNPTRLWTPSVG
jgi:hypothetical protein